MTADPKNLQEQAKKNSEGIATLAKNVGDLTNKLSKTRATGPSPEQVFGAPNVRTGEDTMSSRGFSFIKAMGFMAGVLSADQAKHEINVSERLYKSMQTEYEWGGSPNRLGYRLLVPLCASFLPADRVDNKFRAELKELVLNGVSGADYDEMKWVRTKQLEQAGYNTKTLSWLNELLGGSLVAPPEQGELIELLRNKEALVNAGARTVPLPPQGRLKYPRQTAASNTYWVGENAPITESDVGTGEILLQAKKLAVLIKAPNELMRFASPAAEALLRDDMTKSLALGLDLAGLEGLGGDTRPRGIINHQFINVINSSSQTASGDRIVGNDIYRFIAAVEESNAEFEGFIMRPKTLYKYYQLRSDAVAQGDAQGPFLFNLVREAGAGTPPMLAGYPVTKSTQVSQVRAKGGASNLTYIVAGMWSDLLIGMFGALEFAATTLGDTAFTNDQTWIRGILSADIQARHDASFVFMDNLDTTL